MRTLAAAVAATCALVLSACASIHVERAAPARPATVRTAPGGATVVTPGTAPSYVFLP